jgi:hypothetical protein
VGPGDCCCQTIEVESAATRAWPNKFCAGHYLDGPHTGAVILRSALCCHSYKFSIPFDVNES